MKFLLTLFLLFIIPFTQALCETDKDCDDQNSCTINKCIGPTGDNNGCSISNTPLGIPCNDQYQCTEHDICDGQGRCEGTPRNQLCLTHCSHAECNPKLYPQNGCGNFLGCNTLNPLINYIKDWKLNRITQDQLNQILKGWAEN